MALAFSMIPLWMTAMRPDWSRCGWAFGVVAAPGGAQRVCPRPTVPLGWAARRRAAGKADREPRVGGSNIRPRFALRLPSRVGGGGGEGGGGGPRLPRQLLQAHPPPEGSTRAVVKRGENPPAVSFAADKGPFIA